MSSLLLFALLALFTFVRADDDADVISCGSLLPNVAALCSQPDHPAPKRCCAALRAWHDAGCWCEASAIHALTIVAANDYAFSGRARFCGIATPRVSAMPPPSRYALAPPSSCSPLPIVPPKELGCARPTALAAKRIDALARLDSLSLKTVTKQTVAAFHVSAKAFFAPYATLSFVGELSIVGSGRIADILLARQPALDPLIPMHSGTRDGNVQWRSARQAAYTLMVPPAPDAGPYAAQRSRFVFATFEPCSARISALAFADSSFLSAQYAQFFYADRAPPALAAAAPGTSATLCKRIAAACGTRFPYASQAACLATAKKVRAKKRIACNRFRQRYVPQLALHGDSLACRAAFADVARIHPGRYCAWLGDVGEGICSYKACPGALYDDMFSNPAQRYSSATGGFTNCTETRICDEYWPNAS